jgi:hypothetical protein
MDKIQEHDLVATLAQRRGGHPTNLLQDAAPSASLRENRKQAILEHIQNRHQKSN